MPSLSAAAAITPARLKQFAPDCRAVEIAPVLDAACAAQEIDTPARVAGFLGEAFVESLGFTRLEEDLVYSDPKRIVRLWPAHVPTLSLAQKLVRNPQALADAVYGGRCGNTEQGDGWRYRGRGWLQVTFKDNYRAVTPFAGVDLVAMPDRLADPRIASTCAAAWWTHRGLNAAADRWDVDAMSEGVNGGKNALQERRLALAHARQIWAG